jgi:Carboxypeptidase regulatory-like domain/TonB dependent receptor
MRNGWGIHLAITAILSFGFSSAAYSQATTAQAQLNGTVRDQSGGAVAKATITLRELDTNSTYTTTSNSDGLYIFAVVPPGIYELMAEFSGFGKYTQTGIVLRVAQIATIDITLKVAQAGEKIVVTTETPVIEPTRTEISQVVDTEQIKALPISGRLFTDFALLSPGVSVGHTSAQSPFTDPTVTRISFGGQRDLNNAVTVDGADNIMAANGSQRATPSQEAVSEFRVVNNSFGAEYGRALGGIVNIVTKSGTNDLHGSVYDYLQNNATNARSILTLPSFNTLRQNQFGATLGGPIQRDKTFFFINYEGQRRAQSPTYPGLLFAPVDAGVAGLFPAGFTNLQAINAVKPDLGIPAENLSVLKTADNDNGFIKLDHQFNKDNRVSVRYSILDGTALNQMVGETLDGGGIGLPSAGRNGLTRDQALVGNWTSQLSPTIVNSLLGQWARRNYGFIGVTGQPNLDVPNLLAFGHNFGAFERYNETRVQFSDTVSWVKDKHFAKFGVDTNYVRNFVIWPGFTPSRDIFASLDDLLVSGQSNWNTAPCPFPLNATLPSPPFPPNTPALRSPCTVAFFWGAPIGPGPFDPTMPSPPVGTTWKNAFRPDEAKNFDFNLNHNYWGFFAQDQWRITPKLTLNYGARYDFETGLDFFVNGDHHGIQPRIGIAYSPDSKTVIRAGYGIFFDRYTLTFFFVPGPQRPLNIPGLPTSKNMITGTWLLNSAFLGVCQPSFVPPGALTPPCPPGSVPSDVINAMFENFITGSVFNNSLPSVTDSQFPNNQPAFQGGSVVDRNQRKPYSEQSSLEIDREIGKGLSVSAGYLFVAAHHLVRPIDLNVAPHVGVVPGTTNKDLYNFAIPVPSIPAPPGGSSGSGGIFYFTDSSGNSSHHGMTLLATEKAGKYFRLSANYTFSKTLDDGKFLVFVDTPQSNDQRRAERAVSNQNVRHRFVANFVADAPDKPIVRNFEFSGIVTVQSPRPFTIFVGFDANHDGNPVNDRVGQSARDTYLGDSLRTVDLPLSRQIHLNERSRLELSVDSFNLFNRANVDEVFTVYGAPLFIGAVPKHYKDGVVDPANPTFGSPRTMLNPRQFQFAAKLIF